MRSLKSMAMISMCILILISLDAAGGNNFGVTASRNVELAAPTLVGGVLLPAGEYKVLHTMEGQDHVMVFKQLHTKKPAEARVRCQLVPLPEKAQRDEQVFNINAANGRELRALVFKGDSTQHVF
jgi:hypothetical protein